MKTQNTIEIENALIKALTAVYLRTFGGNKADYPSKEEMAQHIVSQIGENYIENNDVKEATIKFLETLPNNLVIKTNVGHVQNEKLFPRNLMHHVYLGNPL